MITASRTSAPPGALRVLLEQVVSERRGQSVTVRLNSRVDSDYRSTAPLQEVDAVVSDGARLPLILKALGGKAEHRGPHPGDGSGTHERAMYESVLSAEGWSVPELYGVLEDDTGGAWMVLERIEGRELYQVGELDVWVAAARWLGSFHRRFMGRGAGAFSIPLPTLDRSYFRRWLERARRFAEPHRRSDVDGLAHVHQLATDVLMRWEGTLLHGEFYPSNVLTRPSDGSVEIVPVDWETAAVGPGLIDLAALTTGSWSEDDRVGMETAYYEAAYGARDAGPAWSAFRRGLEAGRLHLAVKWLGWSKDWTPPPEHATDWMAEARRSAGRLAMSEPEGAEA